MKQIEIIADSGHLDTLVSLAEHHEVLDHWYTHADDGERNSFRMLVDDESRQSVLDRLQGILGSTENVRIVVTPVEAVLPRPNLDHADEKSSKLSSATREELYSEIAKGGKLDQNFLILTFLSTIVAAIGLLEGNVAVVIGAMVIAPLLGPNIALAFASTLGDRRMMADAVKTNLSGLILALGVSMAIGLIWHTDQLGSEILSRTSISYEGVVLALASGTAGALSLTTSVASTLVGVMVAVALLPPTAVLGMMLALGHYDLASGAALLLAINIASVNLSASLVFVIKGIRPRTWLEKSKARQSTLWTVAFWLVMLAILLTAVYLRNTARV